MGKLNIRLILFSDTVYLELYINYVLNKVTLVSDFAGDHGTVLQPSSLAQQQQQQVSSEEKNDVLDNTERNTVQEPQNEMATKVDLQSKVEKPEDKVFDVTGMYVCTLRTVSSVFCLLLTLQSMCTSLDGYGSGSQTFRLPSVPEEEENQQHQYDRDNNNIFKACSP